MAASEDGTSLDWPGTRSDGDSGEVYARYAEIYDAFFGDIRADAAFYLAQARDLLAPGGHLLEIGSGTGRVSEHFLKAGYRVTGVDASEPMLRRATERLASHGESYRSVLADVRALKLDGSHRLAIAPYGMVAHLLTDADRLATFKGVYDHLEPGGRFIFDDMPGWLAAALGHAGADGSTLDVRKTAVDPATGMTVRLMLNMFDVADAPYTVRYDFIDWLSGDRVARRRVIRVVFRNIALEDELALLHEAGFSDVRLHGAFDGRPFDREKLASNERIVLSCRRAR
jgi:SAM-dependent methyltransferase